MFLTSSPIADLLLISIVAVIGGHALRRVYKRQFLVFDPLNAFWGGVMVCYVLQPIGFYRALVSTWSDDALVRTLFWALFGIIWVIIGYESPLGVKWGMKIPRLPARLRPSALCGAGVFLIFLGFLGYVYLISTAGSLSEWLSVGRGGTNYGEVSGTLTLFESMLPAGVALLLFHVEFHRVGGLRRTLVWILGLLMVLWFMYLGSRSRTIAFTLMLLTAYFIPRYRNPKWWLMAVLTLAIYVVVTFQGTYRGLFTNLSFNLDKVDWTEFGQKLVPSGLRGGTDDDSNSFSGGMEFNCVMAVVELVPDRVPYNYGYTMLELVTRPIPRQLWPAKRYPLLETQTPVMQMGNLSNSWVDVPNGLVLSGPAFTYIGYWYHAGGPIALVLAGLLTGGFFRALRTMYDRDPTSQGTVLFYATMVPQGFGDAAGTPWLWIWSVGFAVLALLLVLWFTRQTNYDLATEDALPA